MFDRFTDGARRAVILAQDEARVLNHDYIGTEHLLLGLLREGDGMAAKALEAAGVSLDGARQQVRLIVGTGEQAPGAHIPFTPRAKNALESSLRESLGNRSKHIDTEHLLLGLLREAGSTASQVLAAFGADPDAVRHQVHKLTR